MWLETARLRPVETTSRKNRTGAGIVAVEKTPRDVEF